MKQHQTTIGKNDEWLTPPEIISALSKQSFFDLDPCDARNKPQGFQTAINSLHEGGLEAQWEGEVFCNPPFHRYERPRWMEKMCLHNNGVLLVPAACETAAFFDYVWNKASGICFLEGRPHFHYVDGRRASANSGCTICLVSYGQKSLQRLINSELGHVIEPKALQLK